MGSAGSKTSRVASTATGTTIRKYPNRPGNLATADTAGTPAATARPPQRAQVHPPPSASTTRDNSINIDASDPDFARSLRSIGPVQPFPTRSANSPVIPPSSSRRSGPDPRANPALLVLEARAKFQAAADREFESLGTKGHPGREFLDAGTIRQILILRDRHGRSAQEIEKQMGLKPGVVARLGPKGVFGVPDDAERTNKPVEVV